MEKTNEEINFSLLAIAHQRTKLLRLALPNGWTASPRGEGAYCRFWGFFAFAFDGVGCGTVKSKGCCVTALRGTLKAVVGR
jgi:hypothetical protein